MDVGLFFTSAGIVDVRLTNRDLDSGRDLETALIISIWTNRRARDDDRLPDTSGYLGGWWGDTFPEKLADEIGSRLWLLSRETRTQATLNRAKEYLIEAVQWLLDDGVADRVNVSVEYDKRRLDTMLFQIEIYRPGTGLATFKFDYAWQQFDFLTVAEQASLDGIIAQNYLRLETGDALLQEDSGGLLLEEPE